LTGFAHGNAGIAYALTALAEVTGEPSFEHAAAAALAYERSLFSPEQRNWPDLRNGRSEAFAAAWCHGAPGIGLSRLHVRGVHANDPFVSDETYAALATTMAQGPYGDHTLCHGDLGNADILLQASVILQDRHFRVHAEQIATSVMQSAAAAGWLCGNPLRMESPGLMTGLAGIGYAFLRLAGPARIPSVLALEAPLLI
jgi:lantibiotic modifying enzyme